MKKTPHRFAVAGLLLAMLATLMICLIIFKTDPHMPLIGCLILLSLFALWHKASWEKIEKGLVEGISKGLKPILILALIGMLIGVWMASGTVPYLVSAGFHLISPQWFLITALVSAMIVSTFTGSSFTTVGTVGAALIGIGLGFGISPALCAGAIICGACFGDKMSPLSDTTNFAPAVAGTDIFTHIRHMTWTTVPAILITAILFIILGQQASLNVSLAEISHAQTLLHEHFNMSLWLMASPLIVAILAFRKTPIIPVLMTGIVTGALTAIIFQSASIETLLNTMQNGFQLKGDKSLVASIVNRGGLQSMMWSISLIFIALGFGGVAKGIGLIDFLMKGIMSKLNKKGHYVTAAVLSSISVNILTGEQYLSILLPGQAYQKAFDEKDIPGETLSRSLEDGGTLVNPLIPWGVSGAFFTQILGVSVLEYLPFVFFLYLSPVFSVLFAYIPGIRNHTLKKNRHLKEQKAS